MNFGLPEFYVVLIIALLAGIWMTVAHKAGYSAWSGLLMCVPLLNLVVLALFLFREWPIQQDVKALRQRLAQYEGAAPVL